MANRGTAYREAIRRRSGAETGNVARTSEGKGEREASREKERKSEQQAESKARHLASKKQFGKEPVYFILFAVEIALCQVSEGTAHFTC